MNLLDISPDKLCEILRSDKAQGLSASSAAQNLREFGKNAPSDSLFSLSGILKELFSNVLFCMFLLLSVFSLFTENRTIGAVCLTTAGVCYLTFYLFCMQRAKSLTQARRAISHSYRVIRDGQTVQVAFSDIVPGDLILLRRGEVVPCDGIVLSAEDLKVCQVHIDSRAQTSKYAYDEVVNTKRPRERALLYCGSVLTAGSAKTLVCNTGKNIRKTKLSARLSGKLPRALETAADYARRLSLGLVGIATVLFLIGTFAGADAYSNFFLLCTIGVSVLPELCQALSRLVLVLPLERLKHQGCLIQNYACLDELLRTDRILVDSASYFLDSEIRPAGYFYSNCPHTIREVSEGLFTLISYCRLCCEDKPKRRAQMWYGKSSVDAAICRTAPDFGIDAEYLAHSFLTVSRAPFEEVRGYSAALILQNERCYQLVRGRPTEVLDLCTHSLQDKRSVALSASAKARLYQAADQMAAGGEVVVAVARRYFRSVPENLNPADASYLTFVGFLSFHTPMRAESAEAVAACRRDGVRVLLCTDNDPDATLGIARGMEFFSEGENPSVLTGEKTRRMDEITLEENLESHKVFCGLTALGRRGVILAQKRGGHTLIACTHSLGDTLSQEAADVNVVCVREHGGALVQNADIVLTAERFELLPEAMRISRTVALNSLRILRYSILLMIALFSCALFSLFLNGGTALLQPLPVLLLGLVFFLFVSIAQSTDKPISLSLAPIVKHSFLNQTLKAISAYSLTVGLSIALASAASYLLSALFCLPAEASAAALCTLYLSALWSFFGARKTQPIQTPEFNQNPLIYACVPLSFVLQAVLLFIPAVRSHIGLLLPPIYALPISLLLSLIPLLVGEGFKHVKLRKLRK